MRWMSQIEFLPAEWVLKQLRQIVQEAPAETPFTMR
jgi:hypothetical protein